MLAFRIALRYIFSKKSTNAINVISAVSMLGMGVGAFALIVVLSVFNGFEGLVLSLYSSFYPDLELRAAQGKTFEDDTVLSAKILKLDGISALSRTLEENAYLEYGEQAQIGTVKGVDEKYNEVTTVNRYVRDGKFLLSDFATSYAVVGANISYSMNMDVNRGMEPLRITVPRKGVKNALMPEDAFNTMSVIPAGVYIMIPQVNVSVIASTSNTSNSTVLPANTGGVIISDGVNVYAKTTASSDVVTLLATNGGQNVSSTYAS